MQGKFANIMLLGRTGVGKSSFINYLVGEDVCKVGTGAPITQGFDTYQYDSVDGIPLRIFDSKGLEVLDYQTIRENIFNFIKDKCDNEDIYNWIHSIFYCVNVEGRRLEDEEISFIKEIKKEISQTVHIILTHCKQTEDGLRISKEMESYIKNQLWDNEENRVHIYCVNSKTSNTRNGIHNAFGRENVLEQIFELLWSDISHKVANEYAKELHGGLMDMYQETVFCFDGMMKKFNTFKLIGGAIKAEDEYFEALEKEIDSIEPKIDAIEKKLNNKYQAKINPLVEFCNGYSRGMGEKIKLFEPLDFVDESIFDFSESVLDNAFSNTKTGKAMEEMDDMDDDNVWEIIKGVGKVAKSVFYLKKSLKEVIAVLEKELLLTIPSIEKIEKAMYEALMEGHQV